MRPTAERLKELSIMLIGTAIDYDVPASVSNYVHRVEGTAKASKQGHTWTLFTSGEAWWFLNEIGRSNAVERLRSQKYLG
jgi:ATP-dependent RNA helicase DDX51/DBP6